MNTPTTLILNGKMYEYNTKNQWLIVTIDNREYKYIERQLDGGMSRLKCAGCGGNGFMQMINSRYFCVDCSK